MCFTNFTQLTEIRPLLISCVTENLDSSFIQRQSTLLRFVKRACLSVKEIRTKTIWIDIEILFWFVLVQYWRYKSAILPPLPLWKMDQNIGILFLMNLFHNFHRLTRISLPYFLFDKGTRLLGNELNGVFVCKDVFNSLVSRPFEFWILCWESLPSLTNYLIKFPPAFLTKVLRWVDYL